VVDICFLHINCNTAEFILERSQDADGFGYNIGLAGGKVLNTLSSSKDWILHLAPTFVC